MAIPYYCYYYPIFISNHYHIGWWFPCPSMDPSWHQGGKPTSWRWRREKAPTRGEGAARLAKKQQGMNHWYLKNVDLKWFRTKNMNELEYTFTSMYIYIHIFMYVCMYVCTYVRMYVCIYVHNICILLQLANLMLFLVPDWNRGMELLF